MARLPVSKTGRGGSNPSAPAKDCGTRLGPGAGAKERRPQIPGGDGKHHG